jgi:hypothetical protein
VSCQWLANSCLWLHSFETELVCLTVMVVSPVGVLASELPGSRSDRRPRGLGVDILPPVFDVLGAESEMEGHVN